MNGQRVWGIAHKGGEGVRVEKLQWRPDGRSSAESQTERADLT
jgi:hypothetical protein